MNIFSKILLIIASVSLLNGCSAIDKSIKHGTLDVQTKMSETVFLDPVADNKRTVVLQIRNTSDKKDLDILSEIKVAIFGMTFKEDCPDYRNSKSFNIQKHFSEFNVKVEAFDVYAQKFPNHLNVRDYPQSTEKYDAIIIAVNHAEYRTKGLDFFLNKLNQPKSPILFDVKGIFKSDLCLEL